MGKNKKKLKIIIFTTLFTIFFFVFFGENLKDSIKTSLNDNNVIKYKFFKDLIKVIAEPRYIINDYNVNFLPETEFLSFDSFKFKINKDTQAPHFVEIIDKNLLIISNNISIYFKNVEDINLKKKRLQLKEINNNLKNLKIKNILNTKFYNNKLYISYKKIINNNCNSVGVANADFNFNNLKFTELFFLDECAKGAIWGGAIDVYKTKNSIGLLLSTSDVVRSDDENTLKDKDNRPQDNNSFYHKILYYDFEKRNIEIFSKGHRNPGSILVNQEIIISTEHGPRGGDEINLIKKNGNYGWPISSYGDLYFTRQKNPFYEKSHKEFGYIEPIFSYVPSIGISTIIKVPENFSKFWHDNYLIASLYGNSLHRIKFDSAYNKILFNEKIFLGERIRDIKFYEKNLIILTFESGLDLGILKIKK
jgi:hypothetical protein